jgi:beta-lactamase class A
MMRLRIVFAALLPCAVAAAAPERPAQALSKELARLAAEAKGSVGVAVIGVESGERISLAGQERFPLASVFKLPLAIEFLRQVDAGRLRLDNQTILSATDLEPGWSPMARAHPLGGIAITTEELLEQMLVEGDNTAADRLLSLCGGPAAVTAQLRGLSLPGIRIDRSERQLALDYCGVTAPPSPWSLPAFEQSVEQVSPARRRSAATRFLEDPRDTATPEAVADLLARLQQRRLGLSPASYDRLLALLSRCRSGPGRLKGLLPPGAPVAHRTGACGETEGISACTNDVGILTLPRGEHLAVAVFVKASPKALVTRERTIAKISRAIWDYWNNRSDK